MKKIGCIVVVVLLVVAGFSLYMLFHGNEASSANVTMEADDHHISITNR